MVALVVLGLIASAVIVSSALRATAERVAQVNPLRILPTLVAATTPTITPAALW